MDSMNSADSSTSSTKKQIPLEARIEWKQFLRLIDRASKQGVTLEPGSFEDYDLASSYSKPGKKYVVNAISCTCEAGYAGMACKHRALYLLEHIESFDAVVYTEDAESANLETEKV